MAAATTLSVMTVGPQQKTMTSLVQPSSASASSPCVIVTTGASGTQHQSSNLLPSTLLHPSAATKTVLVQQKRATAPMSTSADTGRTSVVVNMSTTSTSTADTLRCKRRINFTHNTHLTYSGMPGHQPASVARRNARERNRVKQVNNGFATLRSHIPLSVAAALSSSAGSANGSGGRGASKKLSKVETLRMAVEYIRSLQQLLDDHATETSSTTSSIPETGSSALTTTTNETGYYSSSPESSVTILTATTLPVGPQHFTHHTSGSSHPLLIQQQAPLTGSSLSPPCSEASSSPTPSYASEGSGSAVSSYAAASAYQQENYENYEPMSPEDEELLDVISWWQQRQ